jgi:hypothetical protein
MLSSISRTHRRLLGMLAIFMAAGLLMLARYGRGDRPADVTQVAFEKLEWHDDTACLDQTVRLRFGYEGTGIEFFDDQEGVPFARHSGYGDRECCFGFSGAQYQPSPAVLGVLDAEPRFRPLVETGRTYRLSPDQAMMVYQYRGTGERFVQGWITAVKWPVEMRNSSKNP